MSDTPMFRAADRNKDAILGVLRDILPATGTVLEIASGGGQHIAYFSRALPHLDWQPSEVSPELVAHLDSLTQPNVLPALAIDVCEAGWHGAVEVSTDAIINTNMIHIAPWAACLGLFAGGAELLPVGGYSTRRGRNVTMSGKTGMISMPNSVMKTKSHDARKISLIETSGAAALTANIT